MPFLEESLEAAEQAAARLSNREVGRSKRFYSSLPWRRLRYRVLAENADRNGGVARCELCKAAAEPGSPLDVDHIEPMSRAWDRRLDPMNLQVLCGECNHGKLNGPARDWREPAAEESEE